MTPLANNRPRAARLDAFLARCGWAGAGRAALAGDASFRRYHRLEGAGGRAVLMDAPPPQEDVRPFARVARYLASLGLSAPAVLAADGEAGFLLLEDLGDDLYARVLRDGGADERTLYLAAVDVLIALHRAAPPDDFPPYDDALFRSELALLTDWFMPLAGLEPTDEGRSDFFDLWDGLLPLARSAPDRIVLRDYHADNLLWLPERRGAARVGLLDFQDAAVGPATYDLVSLLEDARRDVAAETVEACVERYLSRADGVDREGFLVSCAVMGAQRNLKIAGIFCRLLARDGKPGYQVYMDRVWGHIARGLGHPALAPLADWLDRWIPPSARTRAA